MAKKRVLGVVGMGHVGAHVAYALAIQGIADELVLVDQNEQKLASEVQDLRDAVAYMPHRVTVRGGDFSDLGVCDVIVNSVGKIDLLRGTHDRVTEMDFTIPAVRGYAEKIKASGFDGVLINITNPCDIVTRELALHLGLPRGRVFGTGTGLDTSRLLSALARQTGIDHKSITCYMMGEHGNQQFAPWSCVSFKGMPLDKWAETGLTPMAAQGMQYAPAIAECPAYLSCKVRQVLSLGSHEMFLGEVVGVSVQEKYFAPDGSLHLEAAHLVGYSHGVYQRCGEVLGFSGYSVANPDVLEKRMAGYWK